MRKLGWKVMCALGCRMLLCAGCSNEKEEVWTSAEYAEQDWVTKLLQQIQTNLYKCIQKYRFYETESPLYREIGANSVLIALNP